MSLQSDLTMIGRARVLCECLKERHSVACQSLKSTRSLNLKLLPLSEKVYCDCGSLQDGSKRMSASQLVNWFTGTGRFRASPGINASFGSAKFRNPSGPGRLLWFQQRISISCQFVFVSIWLINGRGTLERISLLCLMRCVFCFVENHPFIHNKEKMASNWCAKTLFSAW